MKNLTYPITALFVVLSTQTFSQEVKAASTSNQYTQQIVDLSSQSTCAKYSWKKRGRAPAGYVKGVALTFARSLCRTRNDQNPAAAKILSAASSGSTSRDALAHYKSIFSNLGINVKSSGDEAVRAIYTLGFGLGMRESSGKYCEGWDKSAGSRRSSAEAEAGIFQVSYDSMGASTELRRLYNEYKASPQRCGLTIFKEGVTCKSQSILGSGAGAEYQKFNKACPAFATEYAMTMLRLRRSHFGPINRKEAEAIPACNSLLKKVEQIVDANPEAVCAEIY
ncbi:hypothetical protein [Bdellovibrio sp. HCB2-146]|uniref:hypothetical protein n=1 Tax=Bdellovibrio sp. HCB2-146 TaxID=3394362 RepID=UPI0039BD1573